MLLRAKMQAWNCTKCTLFLHTVRKLSTMGKTIRDYGKKDGKGLIALAFCAGLGYDCVDLKNRKRTK